MKVLYLTHCTDLSGANQSMLQMIVELRDNNGIEPFVIYPMIEDASQRSIKNVMEQHNIPGFSHRLSCFQRKNIGMAHKIYFILTSLYNVLHIVFILRNRKMHFDIVHSNSSVMDTGLYIAKFLRIPHIWHFREVASLSFGSKSVLGKKYQKWVYHQTDKIIVISRNVKEEFGSLIPSDRTVIIPNGILPPKVAKHPNHDTDLVNICIVGRVEANKNQLEAVSAINHLIDHGYTNIRLYVIGDISSDYAKAVCDFVKRNNLSDYVVMTGVRTDVNDLLCDMNIGLMLSRHEAFGRVTVEYMMHGLCVIASNTSANPEIIIDGANGLLYEYGNSNDLSEKISRILDNRGFMKAMSQNGYNDALKNYRSVTNSNRVFDVYKTVF